MKQQEHNLEEICREWVVSVRKMALNRYAYQSKDIWKLCADTLRKHIEAYVKQEIDKDRLERNNR